MIEVCQPELWLPAGIPIRDNLKRFCNVRSCFLGNNKWGYNLVANICFHTNEWQRASVLRRPICRVQKAQLFTILMKKFFLEGCLIDKQQLVFVRPNKIWALVWITYNNNRIFKQDLSQIIWRLPPNVTSWSMNKIITLKVDLAFTCPIHMASYLKLPLNIKNTTNSWRTVPLCPYK